jgi:TolB-like protein/cytochrome c-type biogenesis protein CcmH/NrfG
MLCSSVTDRCRHLSTSKECRGLFKGWIGISFAVTISPAMPSPSPESGDTPASRAVFLSYAREDTAVAQRIADALRSQGIEAWIDQAELRGGDAWDQKIRRQIKACALFMPIISTRTQSRGEGYFRLEWKLAVERTHLMAEGVPFLAPVVVDETTEDAAIVPAEFLRVQWIRLPGALPTPQFVEQVKRMLEKPGHAVFASPGVRTASAPAAGGNRTWLAGSLVALALGVAAMFVAFRHTSPSAPAPAAVAAAPVAAAAAPADAVDPKSVAVLPFENMSEDKDNAFFTDGVHEDVLTNLSFIKDLHVISRTSVMQYRGTTKSIKQIGKELGVAYILEGSVRREGNKVRVTGQLIDARTDEHVWAKAYDRDLNDIFAIQGELAKAIASALQAVLSPETAQLIARKPTESTEAYDDYLKARQIRSDYFIGSGKSTTDLLEDAVRLDPNFAQAWAELASRRAFLYFSSNQSDEQLQLAKQAVDMAIKIAPDDPAVIEGVGDYYYYAYRDYARSTEQYMRLEELRPNDASVYESLGLIQRRQGRIADSVDNLRRAVKLDPTNHEYSSSFGETLEQAHHYAEAHEVRLKAVQEDPDNIESALNYALGEFLASGSTDAINAFLRRTVDPHELNEFKYMCRALSALIGNWTEFKRLDREQPYFDGNEQDPRYNQDINAADALAEEGNMPAARARAAVALAGMETALKTQPNNANLWSNIALAHAFLGDRDATLSAAQKSADLLPESRDAIAAPGNSITCLVAFAWIGEKDRALSELQRLFKVPFGANVYACRSSVHPLIDDPRYKKMIQDPANNAPLY